jgi:hypothetical protein
MCRCNGPLDLQGMPLEVIPEKREHLHPSNPSDPGMFIG